MPTWAWLDSDGPNATVGMSYVTPESVSVSEVWKITGSLAAGTLGLVTALAWWHQRRLRRKFIIEAGSLKDIPLQMASPAQEPAQNSTST